MRKIIITVILSAALLAGCGANPTGHSANDETFDTTGDITMSTTIDVDAIDKKLSEALEAIESAATEAISRIHQAAKTTTLPTKTIANTTSTTDSALNAEPKTILINVHTMRGDKALILKAVETVPQYNRIKFYFATEEEHIVLADIKMTKLRDKRGNVYAYEGGGQLMAEQYGCNQDMAFAGITDYSDLSTVTLTYAFEGYEPVTVTFDIPGL